MKQRVFTDKDHYPNWGRMDFDVAEMERLVLLARLPENETVIFTDK